MSPRNSRLTKTTSQTYPGLSIPKPDEHEAAYIGKELNCSHLDARKKNYLGLVTLLKYTLCIAEDDAAGYLDRSASSY